MSDLYEGECRVIENAASKFTLSAWGELGKYPLCL